LSSGIHDDRLPMTQLALLVRDLHKPRPVIYWVDLVSCLLLVQVGLYLSAPFPRAFITNPPLSGVGFVLAVLALYRASYFNHELAHHARRLRGFELAWNFGIGIPLLIPSFLYSDHLNHHSDQAFGTGSDVEYLSPEMRSLRGAAALVGLAFVLPIVHTVRFAVIAPLAWICPAVRRWVDIRASGIGLFGLARRAPPSSAERPHWRRQEVACTCYLMTVFGALLVGILPFELVIQFYAVAASVLILHGVRIMAGHRYESAGNVQSRLDQVRDSFNFTRHRPVTWLLVPLGFHLHALHHLFPGIPYHNLPEAHRRIAGALPINSIYHAVESKSYLMEVARFISRGRDADRAGLAGRTG